MSKLIDEIRAMNPEERKELSAILKDLEPKPEAEHRSIGECMRNPKHVDAYGNQLSAEEIYDAEHPRDLKAYGFCESFTGFDGKTKTKYWTRAEVDAYNQKSNEAWLMEKRKVFPNATLPEE